MRASTIVLGLSLAAAGCLRNSWYPCSTNDQCGANGVCVGFCAFPDPKCSPVGLRYSSAAAQYSNQCVAVDAGTPVDASVDASPDASPDAGTPSCPAGFAPLAAQPHYYKLLTAAQTWLGARTACATQANTYLAIPDDMTELAALDGLAGVANPLYWVGVDDMQTLGTFVNTKGAAQSYLPWAAGQPSNGTTGQPRQCVEAIQAAGQFQTAKCADTVPAICECE